MTSAFIHSFTGMTSQVRDHHGREEENKTIAELWGRHFQYLKREAETGLGEESVCTRSVVSVSCRLRQGCIMEV